MYELPEVEFLNVDPQYYLDEQIKEFEALTKRKLAVADPVYLIFKSVAYVRAKHAIEVNDKLKQQLLSYSRKGTLDHKGDAWNTPRIGGDKATVTMRFTLEVERAGVPYIKKGTIVTPDGNLLFTTTNDVVASESQAHVDVLAECEVVGVEGNGYEVGKINELLNPIQYVKSCYNISVSEGGTEIEGDDAYRQRIHSAPEKLSTAGPGESYEYHTYAVSPLIIDVDVYSPTPGYVDVRFLLAGGEMPGKEMVDKVEVALSDKKVRPLTDNLSILLPEAIEYDLKCKYYISEKTPDIDGVKVKIEKAKNEFLLWQSAKMGRDINPSRLTQQCVDAGAKRLEIEAPIFAVIERGKVAKLRDVIFEFGGIEDD